METKTSTITDAQLVALAERLGFEVDVPPSHTGLSPWLMIGKPLHWLRTPDGALGAIQAAMAGLGFGFGLVAHPGGWAGATFSEDAGQRRAGDGTSLTSVPDAIVLAACAALGLDKEDTRD